MESNPFIRDPIKIIIWKPSKAGWTHQIVVVCGQVPKEVKSEILTRYKLHESNKPIGESKILAHWYGAKWKAKLRFESKVIFGGDPEEVEDVQPTDEVVTIDDEKQIIDVSEFVVEETKAVSQVELTAGSHTFLWDLTLFPEDKISDLKYRINRYLNVPIFRQHIWHMHQGHSFPMKYNISASGHGPIPVDFFHQILFPPEGERIMGIPVEMYLYRLKDDFKIEAYDNFTLIGNLYHQRSMTEYHLVDLESLVEPRRTELNALVRTDKYQVNMLYYAFVIKYWPMINPSLWEEYLERRDLHLSYPQLDPPQSDLSYIDKQIAISNQLYYVTEHNATELKILDRDVRKSLTSTTLKVSSTYRGKVVNFRALFDLLECTPEMDALRFYDSHESRHFILDKYWWQSHKSAETMMPGVMYIRLVINNKPYQRLNLFLYPNGSYTIESQWGEDMGYGFTDVNAIVNVHVTPLINHINKMMDQIMYYDNMRFPLLDKSNVKYVDIAISVFWKQTIGGDEFKEFKNVLDRFVTARIIQEKAIDRNVLSYYFKKGMFELDPKRIEKLQTVNNYYAYLFDADVRQKWFLLFENIRIMTVTHRYSDIKIEISGIKEDEFHIFQQYILLLLWLGQEQFGRKGRTKSVPTRPVKPLNNLKEQDPHLYNFRKVYGSPLVYSKICQRPYQPLLLSQRQYDDTKKSARENVVKYWNFTTKTPAYYQCPNAKYPHIRFITGKHPMGYCIPCCKITAPPDNREDRQRKRHDQCLIEGKFERKTVETSASRYIMSYGKPVDVGRLSNLPETTLEPLFSDTKTESDDGEHTASPIEARYYLYGVPQSCNGTHCGMAHCIATSLGQTVAETVTSIVRLVKVHPQHFLLLCGGEASRWFRNVEDMNQELLSVFVANKSDISLIKPNWDRLFIDLAKIYLNIAVIVFEDINTVIQLQVPQGIVSHEDYVYPQHRHLITLYNQQSGYWNPIYVIHKDIYFRTGMIETRLYDYQSDVIQLIMDMVRSRFIKRVQSDTITLDILRKFLEQRESKIAKLLLTKNSTCYGVNVEGLGFVPVHTSYFRFDADVPLGFSSKEIVLPKASDLIRFTAAWNLWVAKRSQESGFTKIDVPLSRPLLERVEPIYPIVIPELWLQSNDRIIGFQSVGMNWYVQPIKSAKDILDIPVHTLNYNPIEINCLLERAEIKSGKDRRTETVNQALYERYLYRLLVLQFIKLFNRQKNLRIRNEIKSIMARTDFRTNLTVAQLAIAKVIGSSSTQQQTDIDKINSQISDHINHGDRKLLLKTFESDYYNFDRAVLDKLKTLPKSQLIAQLKHLASEIITIGHPTVTDFPNMLSYCSGQEFCKGARLIIPRERLDEYIGILADQIKNPFVEKYLFSPLFASRIIDYFKFIRRSTEVIEIEFD